MTDIVDETIAMWRRGKHVWGQTDCLLSVGDYLFARGYADVASEYRGTYDTEAGALQHIETAGGCDALIDRTGVPRTTEPARRGDVVLVHNIGGICCGDVFALRLERGLFEIATRLVQPTVVWRV